MNSDFIFQYEPEIRTDDIEAITKYLQSGGFITEFKETRSFEKLIAEFCGSKESILFPNGTLTLQSILKQLDIGAGDKVIVPNYTMAATAFSVIEVGAEVIFCDIEWPSLCISKCEVEKIIEEEKGDIAAIMFMPSNGRFPKYEIDDLIQICKANNIYLIEDSAQALGSYYSDGMHIGTKGIAGSISFSMPKIITTGQGGAVLSNDENLLDRLKKYRDFGRSKGGGSDFHETIGSNLKFTDLQAVLGISQLIRISETIKKKKNNYLLYQKLINNKYLKLLPNNINFTTPWFYELVTEYQTELMTWLKSKNIGSRIMYPELNKQKAFSTHKQNKCKFQNSHKISNQGVWIPSHPKLSNSHINYISSIINEFKPGKFL